MLNRGTPTATVVGAGIVGLSVAWYLQEEGFCVTVLDAGVVVRGPFGAISSDHVVLATGAALGALGGRHGVRRRIQAGRGYSFTVQPDSPVAEPLYLPSSASHSPRSPEASGSPE